MAPKRGGLTLSLPPDEVLLLIWPDETRIKLVSQGQINADALWLSMLDTYNPPFLKTLVLLLDQDVEPFPGVKMTFIEKARYRVNIQAPPDIRIYRGDAVRLRTA